MSAGIDLGYVPHKAVSSRSGNIRNFAMLVTSLKISASRAESAVADISEAVAERSNEKDAQEVIIYA